MKIRNDRLAIIVGGLTFLLFSTKPFILDFIEPAKSIGQAIGENAKDLIDSFKGEEEVEKTHSKRETWSNVITVLAFLMGVLTITFSAVTFQKRERKWFGIAGVLLAILGLVIHLSHLAVGLLAFAIIAVLVVVVVVFFFEN